MDHRLADVGHQRWPTIVPEQVSKWLGHSTFTLTHDTYGDWIPEESGGTQRYYQRFCVPLVGLEPTLGGF